MTDADNARINSTLWFALEKAGDKSKDQKNRNALDGGARIPVDLTVEGRIDGAAVATAIVGHLQVDARRHHVHEGQAARRAGPGDRPGLRPQDQAACSARPAAWSIRTRSCWRPPANSANRARSSKAGPAAAACRSNSRDTMGMMRRMGIMIPSSPIPPIGAPHVRLLVLRPPPKSELVRDGCLATAVLTDVGLAAALANVVAVPKECVVAATFVAAPTTNPARS